MKLDEKTKTPDSEARDGTETPSKTVASTKRPRSKCRKWTKRISITLAVLTVSAVGLYIGWYLWRQYEPIEQNVPPNYTELFGKLDAVLSDGTDHPINDALRTARKTLLHIHKNVHDYTAVMSKQLRIDGELLPVKTMFAKIRNRKMNKSQQIVTPLSVYLRFSGGSEVIWVEGRNGGKLLVHNPGIFKVVPVPPLDPNGMIAMMGNRKPISEIGVENLMVELVKQGLNERKLAAADCVVVKDANALKEGRRCTMFEIRHPRRLPGMEFYFARIYIDNVLQVPFFYEAFTWPDTEGGEPLLTDRYTYADIKLNVNLTEMDFDPENEDYDF